VNGIDQPEAPRLAKLRERHHSLLGLASSQNLRPKGAWKQAALDRRRDKRPVQIDNHVRGRRLRHFATPIPQYDLVAGRSQPGPCSLVYRTVRRLVKEKGIGGIDRAF